MGKRSNFERRPARLRCDFADRLQQRILEKPAANAVKQASKSLRNLRVAEIVELDMQLDAKGKVEAYRAKVRLSFKVER